MAFSEEAQKESIQIMNKVSSGEIEPVEGVALLIALGADESDAEELIANAQGIGDVIIEEEGAEE